MSERMNLDEIAWDLWAIHDKLVVLSEYLDNPRLVRLTVAVIILENVCDEITDECITNPGLGNLDRREMQTRKLQETSGNLLSLLATITYRRTMSAPRTPIQPIARTNTDWISTARSRLDESDNRGEWDADLECPFDASHNVECPDDPCPGPCADLYGWDAILSSTDRVPRMGRKTKEVK